MKVAVLSTFHTVGSGAVACLSPARHRRSRIIVRARTVAQHRDIVHDDDDIVHDGEEGKATSHPPPALSRRGAIAGSLATMASASLAPQAAQAEVKLSPEGLDPSRRFFQTFPPLWEPYFGWGERVTVKRELVPGVIWSLEQEQALDVLAMNVRTTVVKLTETPGGGLVVFSPQAPTEEFFRLLDEIGEPVRHIVLPTYALEHKVFVPAMSRRYPSAQVWVAPGVWSVPVDLPLSWLGINATGTLVNTGDGGGVEEGEGLAPPPWARELECKILQVDSAGANPYIEAVFYHKATRTLLVTDLVLSIPSEPPEVISRDRLLNLAPDDPVDAPAPLSDQALRTGWAKASLVVSFLGPSRQQQVEGGKLKWDPGYEKSFATIADRVIPSPILRTLVFSKGRKQTGEFIDEVCRDWGGDEHVKLERRENRENQEGEGGDDSGAEGEEGDAGADAGTGFNKIVAAHYDAPIVAGAAELRRAFAFLDNPGQDGLGLKAEGAELPEEDMGVLLKVSDALTKLGL